ncbi:hypothetical protein M501DRAFT_989590 [Patellaria atrata CBS 101060]|uniref:Uncharacterized protein n=1 Tax=Patellaria atrata CBS 101060 TaxID=1346257 RepID=A0A9P4VMG9_9PEZI|nr:hypothetical protein M501DRAFT_989590 [Patellaria atrata CBS 101060]
MPPPPPSPPQPSSTTPPRARPTSKNTDTFNEQHRRYEAARFLESNEMLVWWASVRNESIPQTRLHFERILAGMPEPEEDLGLIEEWRPDEEDELRVAGPKESRKSGMGVATGSGSGAGGGSGDGKKKV